MATYAAVDLGASGGRVVAGSVDGERIRLDVVHRFANGMAERHGHLRWDLTRLFTEVVDGLTAVPAAVSIGIDTWAVDYGLLDANGDLLAEPIAYRDERTAAVIDDVHALVPREELYAITGVQFLPFNTIYQLAAERRGPLWSRAVHVVLVPDLLAYWLTGELRSERTNASTTGLLDVHRGDWSTTILDRLHIDAALLPAIEHPGVRRGTYGGVGVTTVGSHDTASAVVAVPATTPNFAYISSGTWSLVGLELDAPVLTEAARSANFTNEAGVGGTIRFLRNVGGLWLFQQSMEHWATTDVDALVSAASAVPRGPIVDVDDPAFLAPGDMPTRLAAASGLDPHDQPAITRCILDSLATRYAETIADAARLAGRTVDVVHIVGGGSQNELLCQLTADATGLQVVAGPVEATALGNVAVQAMTAGELPPDLAAVRHLIAACSDLHRYEPR